MQSCNPLCKTPSPLTLDMLDCKKLSTPLQQYAEDQLLEDEMMVMTGSRCWGSLLLSHVARHNAPSTLLHLHGHGQGGREGRKEGRRELHR